MRPVYFRFLKPNGQPWKRALFQIRLVPGSFDADGAYPEWTGSFKTDDNGESTVSLWTNELGDLPSWYEVTGPDRRKYRFVLPEGETTIDYQVLVLAGITPVDPTYRTVLKWIEENLIGQDMVGVSFDPGVRPQGFSMVIFRTEAEPTVAEVNDIWVGETALPA